LESAGRPTLDTGIEGLEWREIKGEDRIRREVKADF